jgi:hypothetical protein
VDYSRFTFFHETSTFVDPAGLVVFAVSAISLLAVPRRYALVPFLLLACFVPDTQRILIFGLDFTFLRLLILLGWLRVLMSGDRRPFTWTPLDRVFVAWMLAAITIPVLRTGSASLVVTLLGNALDSMGLYFLCRQMVRSWKDVDSTIVACCVLSIPVAGLFLCESITHVNPLGALGLGSRTISFDHGRFRAKGAFAHPIIAGVFWATLIPLMGARLWKPRASKSLSIAAIVSALIIVLTCQSSTALFGVPATILGAAIFFVRKHMRLLRRGLVVLCIALELVMDKHIWHLWHRVGQFGIGGSTGYHRYRLIDAFVNRFDEWALLGTRGTAHWGFWLQDITNTFVAQGVNGGLLTLILFIALFVYAYKQVGWILRATARSRSLTIYAWALGVTIFTQNITMTAVSFYSELKLVWFISLAFIGSIAAEARSRQRQKVRARHSARPLPSTAPQLADTHPAPHSP